MATCDIIKTVYTPPNPDEEKYDCEYFWDGMGGGWICLTSVISTTACMLDVFLPNEGTNKHTIQILEGETRSFTSSGTEYTVKAVSIFEGETISKVEIEACYEGEELPEPNLSLTVISQAPYLAGSSIEFEAILTYNDSGIEDKDIYLVVGENTSKTVQTDSSGKATLYYTPSESENETTISIVAGAYENGPDYKNTESDTIELYIGPSITGGGEIICTSDPASGVTVRLDGLTYYETTPCTIPEVSEGDHIVTFMLEGYDSQDITVTVLNTKAVNAHANMVPSGIGINITVNLPGLSLEDEESLYVMWVEKVPLTDEYYNPPLYWTAVWKNVVNGIYYIREKLPGTGTDPRIKGSWSKNQDYAIFVGESYIAFYPSTIVTYCGDTITEIELSVFYLDWLGERVCKYIDCDALDNYGRWLAALGIDLLSPIADAYTIYYHQSLYTGNHEEPTAWTYLFFAIGCLPGIGIVKKIGKADIFDKAAELANVAKKNELIANALEEGAFILKWTDLTPSQIDTILDYAKNGDDIRLADFLKTIVKDIPYDKLDEWESSMAKIIGSTRAQSTMAKVLGVSQESYMSIKLLKRHHQGVELLTDTEAKTIVYNAAINPGDFMGQVLDFLDDAELEELAQAFGSSDEIATIILGDMFGISKDVYKLFLQDSIFKPFAEKAMKYTAETGLKAQRYVPPSMTDKTGAELFKEAITEPIKLIDETPHLLDYTDCTSKAKFFADYTEKLPKLGPLEWLKAMQDEYVPLFKVYIKVMAEHYWNDMVNNPWGTVKVITKRIFMVIGSCSVAIWAIKEMFMDAPIFNMWKAVGEKQNQEALNNLAYLRLGIDWVGPMLEYLKFCSPIFLTTMGLYIENCKATHDMYCEILGHYELKYYSGIYKFDESYAVAVKSIIDGDTIICNFKVQDIPEEGATSAEKSLVFIENQKRILEGSAELLPGDLEMEVRFLGVDTIESSKHTPPYEITRQVDCKGDAGVQEKWYPPSNAEGKKVFDASVTRLSSLAYGNVLLLSDHARQYDKYHRFLAVVKVGSINLGEVMLMEGFGALRFYDYNKQIVDSAGVCGYAKYVQREHEAKDAGLGIWSFGKEYGEIYCHSIGLTACEIWLDNVNTGKKTSNNVYTLENISIGTHILEFKKYVDSVLHSCKNENIIVIKNDTVIFECTPVPGGVTEDVGSIYCHSIGMTACEIWMDESNTGKKTTNEIYTLENIIVGTHTLEFKKYVNGELYSCKNDNIIVIKDKTVNFECIPVPGGLIGDVGSIYCHSIGMTACEIWMDESNTGKKTTNEVYTLQNVIIGSHNLEFRKYVQGVFYTCGKTITVIKDELVNFECTPTESIAPPMNSGVWNIRQAIDQNGDTIYVSKVFVDGVYVGGYTPEILYFGPGENYKFGSHEVSVEADYIGKKYKKWSSIKDVQSGDKYEDFPILNLVFVIDILSSPKEANISTTKDTSTINLITTLLNKLKKI